MMHASDTRLCTTRIFSRGFGLVETLVALLLLSIGMAGTLSLLTRSIGLARSDLQARAALRADADAEELRALQPAMTTELHSALADELQRVRDQHQTGLTATLR